MDKASIFIIPNEIISDFLVYAHTSNEWTEQSPPKTDTDFIQRYRAHRRSIATLSSVCRLFHSTTIKTPQLWTQINIPSKLTPSLTSHIQQQLARSGTLPLSIQYDASCPSVDFFSRNIVPHFPRCRDIHLNIRALSPGVAVAHLLEECLSRPLPKLRSLKIAGTGMLSMYAGLGLFPALNAPMLRIAQIEGFLPQFTLQHPPLTSLTLCPLQMPLEDLMEYLGNFKETLQVVDIESNHLTEAEDMFIGNVVHEMKCLETCRLKMGFYSAFMILSTIRAPSLKRLEVDLLGDPGEPVSVNWTPWNLHAPSELVWTINHINSIDHLQILLLHTPSISKLEVIIPQSKAGVSASELSICLMNKFLNISPDDSQSSHSDSQASISDCIGNISELQCQGIEPNHLLSIVCALSPTVQKVGIRHPFPLGTKENPENTRCWRTALSSIKEIVDVEILDCAPHLPSNPEGQ